MCSSSSKVLTTCKEIIILKAQSIFVSLQVTITKFKKATRRIFFTLKHSPAWKIHSIHRKRQDTLFLSYIRITCNTPNTSTSLKQLRVELEFGVGFSKKYVKSESPLTNFNMEGKKRNLIHRKEDKQDAVCMDLLILLK
jgi:hypothetical protein